MRARPVRSVFIDPGALHMNNAMSRSGCADFCRADSLACIIQEDSASRVIIAKQVARSPEKRGLPRAEGDRVRCDAIMASGVE